MSSTARGPIYSLLQSRRSKTQRRYKRSAQSHQHQSYRAAACCICSSYTYNREGGLQGMLEGRRGSQGVRRELLSRAYLARIVHGSRSLLAQADLQARELGSRLDESPGGLRRYGYRCLDVLL